jgi:hypothetical protein
MQRPVDSLYELELVCRALGEREEDVWELCRLLGMNAEWREGEYWLPGDTVRRLYALLFPPYSPPEEAA